MLRIVSAPLTVTTSGTAKPLLAAGSAAPSNVVWLSIQAETGSIAIGDSTAKYTSTPKVGMIRASTDAPFILSADNDAIDLAKIYIDASANGTVVNVLYLQKV